MAPLLIGVSIIFYQYSTLSKAELTNIVTCFKKADYTYIFISLVIALFGYWSRAYRWNFALNHLGYHTKFYNNLLTVSVSYLVNLTIPRSGEVSRAALLKKYEDVPFDKAFGTIVAERIVDLLVFFIFVIVAFFLQFDKLYQFLSSKISFFNLLLFAITGIVLAVIFILIWIYSEWQIIQKLKNKLAGLLEGIFSIVQMKNKWKYIFHSFTIWLSYLLMFYITIFALPETQNISFDVVIMGFVFGSLAIGFTNGGLGAYPLAIAMVFSLFGVKNDIGTAFGLLIWVSQTLLTIVIGILSYLLLPVLNKK